MKIVSFRGNWTAENLGKMVSLAPSFCGHFLVVAGKRKEDEAAKILEGLSSHLVERKFRKRWPGTTKVGQYAESSEVHKFEITEDSMQFVQGIIIPTLFLDWPPVEDISFLRKDGRPWLITIMHEKEAYFMLDPDEVPLVMGQLPPHSLIAEGDAESPDERY